VAIYTAVALLLAADQPAEDGILEAAIRAGLVVVNPGPVALTPLLDLMPAVLRVAVSLHS
jgi:hypothetical protein